MITNVYNYFFKANSLKKDHKPLKLRKWVTEVLDIFEEKIKNVISNWNKYNDDIFTLYKTFN